MRPIKLIISAFGPYAECETIDFEKLGNKGLFDYGRYRSRKDYYF